MPTVFQLKGKKVPECVAFLNINNEAAEKK